MKEHLLPPNASDLEQSLSETIARIGDFDADKIRDVWNPQTCPEEYLPWLAWAFSVDIWNSDWPTFIKRGVITNSIKNHRIKGTRKAVQDAIEAMGGGAVLTEWWETSPADTPHTFQVLLASGMQGASDSSFQDDLEAAITAAKPLRSHFTIVPAVELSTKIYLYAVFRAATYNRISLEG